MIRLPHHASNRKTEFLAGLTTFFTMVYIIVVNPVILSDAGVPFEQAFTATVIATVVGTLWWQYSPTIRSPLPPAWG